MSSFDYKQKMSTQQQSESFHNSLQNSDFSAEEDYDDIPSLSNQEILQLVQLERMIKKEQKKLKNRSKGKSEVEKQIPGKLFISNLPFGYDRQCLVAELRKIFKPFGKLKEVAVKHKHQSSTFAFVTYEQYQASQKALQYLKGTLVFGRKIFISQRYEPFRMINSRNQNSGVYEKKKKKPKKDEPIVKIQAKGQESDTYEKDISNTKSAEGVKIESVQKIESDFILKRTEEENAKIQEYIKEKQPNKRVVRTRQLKF